jgi:hypothetical protein
MSLRLQILRELPAERQSLHKARVEELQEFHELEELQERFALLLELYYCSV